MDYSANMRIMFDYMIDCDLPKEFNEDFIKLIPQQRAMVNKLMTKGIITSYAVSIESAKLWMMVIAENEDDIINMLSDFPIANHIKFKINKLAFHNSINLVMPQFSLN